MKIVQTFWSKPAHGNSLMNISAGWLSPEYHWMSWALSCLQAKKFYNDVELVTDERGKEILVDRLQLSYTSVTTGLEQSLDEYPVELWSLAKIFAYSIQQEPFIHLDGDVFIWKPFSDAFCSSALLAQNLEVDIPYYRSVLTAISKRLKYVPEPFLCKNDEQPVYASNTGIFGGHDLHFIKEYCRQAFEFVDNNLGEINNFPSDKRPLFNFVFEQYLLFYLAANQHQHINYFITEPVTDPSYRNYARLLDIPHVPLIHPVGAYKGRPFTCTQLARRLRKEYPDYYYRILDACKNETKLVNKFYYLFEEPPSIIYKKILSYETLTPLPTDIPFSDHIDPKFTELKELEQQRNNILKNLNAVSAYKENLHQYDLTASLFQNGLNENFFNTEICLNPDVILLELTHNWEIPANEDAQTFIENKLKEEPGFHQVILWADPELMEVNEMYLSPVEMIMVDIAKKPVTIRNLLQEAREFFDETEIVQNSQTYIQLVTNSIKLLLYSHILNISKALGPQGKIA